MKTVMSQVWNEVGEYVGTVHDQNQIQVWDRYWDPFRDPFRGRIETKVWIQVWNQVQDQVYQHVGHVGMNVVYLIWRQDKEQ